jgi:hypothetical protein
MLNVGAAEIKGYQCRIPAASSDFFLSENPRNLKISFRIAVSCIPLAALQHIHQFFSSVCN